MSLCYNKGNNLTCIFGFLEENETWINFGSKPENLKSFKNYLDEGTVWMILKNSQSNF